MKVIQWGFIGMRSPAQILVVGFAICIFVGTGLLMLPFAVTTDVTLSFIDALFMATSAVCVTGLAVVDPGSQLSMFGQIVIMLLFQLGGLGFMTLASMMAILLGKRITIKERLLLKEALNQNSLQGIVRLVQYIILMSLAIEALGAVLLAVAFSSHMPLSQAIYFGIFHSVSAFNNAGFDLFSNSLLNYQTNLVVQLTVVVLLVTGGLGFIVLLNIYQQRRHLSKLTVHSKLTIVTSLSLLIGATLIIFVLEYNQNALAHLSIGHQFLNSFFQSASARSAGLSTVNLAHLNDATVMIIILLMFIGASPGSTGGGVKTTTFAIAVLMVWNVLRGRSEISVFYRTISSQIIIKALVLITLSVSLILVVTTLLTLSEEAPFLALLFETVSAFGTVGLSVGVTSQLSEFGKFLLTITMFAGRVGPLTLFFALASQNTQRGYRYPEDNVFVG